MKQYQNQALEKKKNLESFSMQTPAKTHPVGIHKRLSNNKLSQPSTF